MVEAEEAQDLRMVRVTVSDLIDMCSPGPHVVTSEMLQAAVKKTTGDPQVVAADEEKQEDDTKISGSDIKVKSRRKTSLPRRVLDVNDMARPPRPTTLSLTEPRSRPTMMSPPPPLLSTPVQKPLGLLQRRRGGSHQLGATRGVGGVRGLPPLLPRPTTGGSMLRNILTSSKPGVPPTPAVPATPTGSLNGQIFRAPPPPASLGGIRSPPPNQQGVVALPDPVPTLHNWPSLTILFNREQLPVNHLSGIFYCNGNLDNMIICCEHSVGRGIEVNLHKLCNESDFSAAFQFCLYQINSLNSYYYNNMCTRREYLRALANMDTFVNLPQFRSCLDDFRRIWGEMTPCAVVRRNQTREGLLQRFQLTRQYEQYTLRPSEHVGREVVFSRCRRCNIAVD